MVPLPQVGSGKTAEQRDWFHKLGNVLDKLPKRLQPKAKRALHDILAAETREQAEEHLDTFVAEYEAKYPKAAACLATDREALLTFFAFPAEHWIHLRTTNVIESPFATVRLRQRVTKGAGSRTKGLLMAYKLLDMAQRRWRRLNAAHLLPLVRAVWSSSTECSRNQTPRRIGRKPPDHANRGSTTLDNISCECRCRSCIRAGLCR